MLSLKLYTINLSFLYFLRFTYNIVEFYITLLLYLSALSSTHTLYPFLPFSRFSLISSLSLSL